MLASRFLSGSFKSIDVLCVTGLGQDSGEEDGFTDIPQLIADEDVDFLPYVSWPSASPEAPLMELLQYSDVRSARSRPAWI